MASYKEAWEKILASVRVMDPEEKLVPQSTGQVLAEDVYAEYNLPRSDSSGPDGYAVRAADIQAASHDRPVTLHIIETVRAGHLPQKPVQPGTAVRIMTGAVIPPGADCVVRFEDTDEPPDKNGPNNNNPENVKIYVSVPPGGNVNKAGSNTAQGSLVLPKGTTIGPAQISVLTAIGRTAVKVIRRPAVAILSTGDELVSAGDSLPPGKVYDSNGPAIAALVEHYGGEARLLGIARDEEASLQSKLQEGLEADAIILSGGVSRGDYDLVRLTIAKLGELKFARVNIAPGASVSFGTMAKTSGMNESVDVPVFALAGPPAGCLINFETLVRPALLKMLGHTALEHPFVNAASQEAVTAKKVTFARWTMLRETDGQCHVTISNVSMARANSLTLIPEGYEIQPGSMIPVLPLDWCRYNQSSA